MTIGRCKTAWKQGSTIILVAMAVLLWFGWRAWSGTSVSKLEASARSDIPRPVPQLPVVTVVTPVSKKSALSLTLPSTLNAWYQTTLYAKATGYVESIHVDKGDAVRTGEVLAHLDVPEVDKEYQSAVAAVREAEAELMRAKSQADFTKKTYDRVALVRRTTPSVVPPQDVDAAQAAYQKAQADAALADARIQAARAEVARLETLRRFANITAPFDGVITARLVDPGALVQQGGSATGTAVLKIADLAKVRVYTDVPETDAPMVSRGKPAMVFLDAFPGSGVRGRITRFADSLDPQTRTMQTEIDLPNPGHRILPGMYGTVRLDLALEHTAFWVPTPCILHDSDGKSFVYVVDHSKVRKTPVQVGESSEGMIQVHGLGKTDRVVLTATASLQDGTAVKAVKAGS